MKVVLNEVDRGEFFLQVTPDGDVLFPVDGIRALGIRHPLLHAADGASVSLKSLTPDIAFTVDEGKAGLLLTVNPLLLPTQTRDYAVKRRPGVLYPDENSLFLNYSLGLVSREAELDVPLELGARVGQLLFLSGARVTAGADGGFVRNLTSVILDDPSTRVRAVFGDFMAGSGGLGLGSGGVFGGVSISKNFSLDPFYLRCPDIVVRDSLPAPSTVQLYLNDMRTGTEMEFPPGVLELAHLPLLPGANTVALVITDADGKVKRVEIPFYRTTQLLASGVDEYSYSAGFTRVDLGAQSFSYGEPAFLGFHRVGITDWMTGGLRAELCPGLVSGGPTVSLGLGPLGELSSALALSWRGGIPGYAAEADYSYMSKWFGASLTVKYLSVAYDTLSTGTGAPQWEAGISLGVSGTPLGSLSAGMSFARLRDGSDGGSFTVSCSRPLGDSLQLDARISGVAREGRLQYEGSVGIRALMGDATGGVAWRAGTASSGASANIQKNVPRGRGLGYSVTVSEWQDHEGQALVDGSASLAYSGFHGICSASAGYRHGQDRIDAELGARGSLLLMDNSLLFGQPVTDSFAVVTVDGVPGVRVKYANQYVGVTDPAGRAVVPGLSSYNENEVSIEPSDIPMGFTSGATRVYVSPPYRGGGVVRFTVAKFQAVTGVLYVIREGKRAPAAFAGLEIEAGREALLGVVGIDGTFYLENIPAGTYQARLLVEDTAISFDLVVPASTQTIVDLGEIECTVPSGN